MASEIKKICRARGEITVPGDKSISHRAVMFGAIADGTTRIRGFLNGADCLSTIDCFRKMGIEIETSSELIIVHGKGMDGLKKPAEALYTSNSGTTTRLLCGLLSAQGFDSEITGDPSIMRRPMGRVTKPLSLMGADIENEYCPLRIHGRQLSGITYDMPVASAQVKTALILAAMYADGKTEINEPKKSRNHTELMLKAMGADINIDGLNIRIRKTDRLTPQDITVPADISSAAFFLVLGAVMPDSDITLKNVGINPTRTGIIDVLLEMGANIEIFNECTAAGEPSADIRIRTSNLHGVRIDGEIVPRLIDEIPAIAAAALFADGETVIADAAELRVKETDRINAITAELKKCGADITATDDGMIIRGKKSLHGADFITYGDHRMAMSLTIAAQLADGISTLDDPDCVSVSYPDFFNDFYSIGK